MTQKALPEDLRDLSALASEIAPRYELTDQQRFAASGDLETAAALLEDPGEDDATRENSYALVVERIRSALDILLEDTLEVSDDAR